MWETTETFAYEVLDNLVAGIEHRHAESNQMVFGREDGLSRSRDTASGDVSYRF